MNYKFYGANNSILSIQSDEVLIVDIQSALDLIVNVNYEHGCNRIIIDKEAICDEFFDLSSKIAGEILQKFINYHFKMAVVGDYSNYTSKSLHDFIYECNKGNDFYFVDTLEKAIEKLSFAH